MSQNYPLIITSAVAIGGQIKGPKSYVEADEKLAKNLLHRGRARLATEEEIAAHSDGKPAGEDAKPTKPAKAAKSSKAKDEAKDEAAADGDEAAKA